VYILALFGEGSGQGTDGHVDIYEVVQNHHKVVVRRLLSSEWELGESLYWRVVGGSMLRDKGPLMMPRELESCVTGTPYSCTLSEDSYEKT
jgi:hypothetical protein